MIRAIRLELIKPLSEPWEQAGPLLRTLARVTPVLLNAALDAKIAIGVAGKDAVKQQIAPEARARSGDGLAYQAVLRKVEDLRAWAAKKKPVDGKRNPYAEIEVPGCMASAIARTACQGYARRDQAPPRFSRPRILVRASETRVLVDDHGIALEIKLRTKGAVRFACARSKGTHEATLRGIARGEISHGDVKVQYDDERKKWYALLSYEQPDPQPLSVDPKRVLAVHRGVRNALYLLTTDGKSNALRGGKFVAQRRKLRRRCSDIRSISAGELGASAKGHGRSRRMERYHVLDDKIARVTHTWCQQAAAFVSKYAKDNGCSLVCIEDYGGIAPNPDRSLRVVLERFPLHELKTCIKTRLEDTGNGAIAMREVPGQYISSTCPRCKDVDPRHHNARTGIFHCGLCMFERPADWVAAYWLLERGGADMGEWEKRFERERRLASQMKGMAAE